MDFKPFLSGVLSLLFFLNKNVYIWFEVNQASDCDAKVVLAQLCKEGV